MRLHDLRPAPGAVKKPKRVGRGPGSGHGKTSCRGQKGQRSRSGGGVAPWFEGGQTPIHRRLPKRGFKCPTRKEYAIVNLETLEIKFQAGDVVTPEVLREIGLVKRLGHGVKVLARGELTKPLTVKAHLFSRQAIEKIEAAGGKAEVLR
ncbi:MAG TPA: 50S ribosomal protein L15 [Thermosulfidibacter takaii]|uniref:Large ribosomal subunit protein uL15 n=1 Tax=Thermosulfidibacter takaii TaxID=412593 RepID=A0A7C0U6U1_9BACT|nr:MAG: 50S ribosomal protein L15 [Aquificota bacterium]HDD53241.1 50S ribosomal protein L15 [Thermosulfidibacter takaii]